MSWSFRIARLAGIDVKIHFTFFLIILLGAMGGAAAGPAGMALGVALMLTLFLCVLLHEFGHALVAQRFGIPVREIILLPIGGVAVMTRNPATAMQELLVAVAGPLVNVVIAAVLWLALGAPWPLAAATTDLGSLIPAPLARSFLLTVLRVNVMLVLFNMIPAFPLDGGRVLRALLWQFKGFNRATRIAASVGQAAAVLLAIVGLFGIPGYMPGNLFLVIIAFFIFMGAGAEVVEGQARTILSTLRVGDAYNKHALTLTLDDRVSRVVDYLLTSYQPDFAVLFRGKLQGIVTREDVLNHLATSTYDPYVTEIMREHVVRVGHLQTLDEVRQHLAEQQARVAAVFDGELFLGLVSAEDIAEAHAVWAFLRRQQDARAARAGGGHVPPAFARPEDRTA